MPGYPDWQPPRAIAAATSVLVVPNPGVGRSLSITVPATQTWRPIALSLTYANGEAGGINPILYVLRGASTLFRIPLTQSIPGGSTSFVCYIRQAEAYGVDNTVLIAPLPPMALAPGDTLILGVSAASSITNAVLSYEMLSA